jgi:hypothetical protein
MYFSFIRPILEYGDVIWDSNIQYLADKIEHVQIEAIRIVTGGTKLTSIQTISLQCNLYARVTNRYLRSKFLDVYDSKLLGYHDYSSLRADVRV